MSNLILTTANQIISNAYAHGIRILMAFLFATTTLLGGCEMVWRDLKASDVFSNPLEVKLANAIAKGKTEQIKTLVAQGANPNAIGVKNMTPLGWALISGNVDGIEAIIQAGANVHQSFGEDIVWHPIYYACLVDTDEFLRILLQHGADPNFVTKDEERPPLNYVLAKPSKVKLLVEAGANVNVGGDTGLDLVESAIRRGDFQVASYLIEKGYNLNLPSVAWLLKNTPFALPEHQTYQVKIFEQLKQLGITIPSSRPPTTFDLKPLTKPAHLL